MEGVGRQTETTHRTFEPENGEKTAKNGGVSLLNLKMANKWQKMDFSTGLADEPGQV